MKMNGDPELREYTVYYQFECAKCGKAYVGQQTVSARSEEEAMNDLAQWASNCANPECGILFGPDDRKNAKLGARLKDDVIAS